jgi:hypothetical protein
MILETCDRCEAAEHAPAGPVCPCRCHADRAVSRARFWGVALTLLAAMLWALVTFLLRV